MIKIFIGTLFILTVMACGNVNEKTARIAGMEFDSIVIDTAVALINETNAPQCHVKLSVQYAKGKNSEQLNQAILQSGVVIPDYFFIGNQQMSLADATKIFAQRLVTEYLQDYRKLYLQDKNNPNSYQYKFFVSTSTNSGDKDILIYQAHIYTYGGGPYGIQQTVVKNIHMKTGQIVLLDSLFVPGYQKTLEELVLSKICEKFEVENAEELRKKHILTDGNVYVSDNFMMEKDKFTFIYGDSEIAPHEMGEIRIEIPKRELEDILKKEIEK